MKDFKVLRFLDKFSFTFNKWGIDYKVMRRILQLKLIMDERRVPTVLTNQKEDGKERNFFLRSLLSYGLVGFVVMLLVISPLSLFPKMSFSFGMIIFMIMTTMIADFSSVLLDIKDKNILMPKPIDSKTINAAKVIHIFIYLFIIAMVIAGPTLIAGTMKYGVLFFLIFFLDMILISCFIIFLTSLLYSLILNFFDGEKLKDIINYVQIILSITLIIGYQFVGRMFNVFTHDIVFTPRWWTYLIPPAWFAAPFEIFLNKNYSSHYIYLGLLSIVIPIIAIIIHFKIVIPYFEKNLSKLNNNSIKKGRFIEIKERVTRTIAKILCFDRIENIFFRFTQRMVSNERKLKLRIYPNMAFAAVIPLIVIFRSFGGSRSFSEIITEISKGKSYLTIYISVLLLSNLILMLSTSENYKGAWIYKVLPIESPRPIFRGSLKGFMMKYIIPVYLIPSLLFLFIYKFKILIDIIVILLNLILLCIIIFRSVSKELPFCRNFNYVQENTILPLIISMGFCGASAAIHGGLKAVKYGTLGYCLVLLIVTVVLWRRSFNLEWNNII